LRLSQTDAVMEPGVFVSMRQFLAQGGTPPQLIELLSDNYRGYAPLCNLLSDWLMTIGKTVEEVHDIVEQHLHQVILETFDPRKADTIFQAHGASPTWLEQLLEEAKWRQLIYALSEKHKNCLLLNFSIQRISRAGFYHEIAALATASTYFDVFSHVATDSLQHLLTAESEEAFQELLPGFQKMCSHSEQTFLYTQAILQNLLATKGCHQARLHRLYEELILSLVDSASNAKVQFARKLETLALPEAEKHASLIAALYSMIGRKTTTSGSILRLWSEFVDSDDAPPVEYLQQPVFFDLLITDLLDSNKKYQASTQEKILELLAYASARSRHQSREKTPTKDQAALLDALKKTLPICQKDAVSSVKFQPTLRLLKENIKYPVVSLLLLCWISRILGNTEFYTSTYFNTNFPLHLYVLRLISHVQPLQHRHVLRVLVSAFEGGTDLNAIENLSCKKRILENLVFLIQCGCVSPVIRHILGWMSSVDPSLMRHFVLRVIETVRPSSTFLIEALVRILTQCSSSAMLFSAEQNSTMYKFLSEAEVKDEELRSMQKRLLEKRIEQQ